MSYGASLWLSSSGPAPRATSRKKAAPKKKRATSARAAKKKPKKKKSKAAPKKKQKVSKKRSAPRSKKPKAPKPKKAKLYTRYDPVTGKSAKVTIDDWRYDEWSSRKLTKKAREKKLLVDDPLKYVTSVGIESVAKKTGTKVIRQAKTAARKQLPNVGRLVTPGALAAGAAITAGLAGLAAAFVVGEQIAKSGKRALGERINQLSYRFVETQNALIKQFRGTHWSDVPEQVRNKAVADYKKLLSIATSQAQGTAFVGRRAEGSYK